MSRGQRILMMSLNKQVKSAAAAAVQKSRQPVIMDRLNCGANDPSSSQTRAGELLVACD